MPEIDLLTDQIAGSKTTLFGKYELRKLIGCGGFAKVYHAKDIRNGQSVAIKIISKKKNNCTTLVSHIKREISIMRILRHPHIIKLIEVLATKGKIYFVMEYAKGGELFTKVSKARLSENLSRKYFQQLIAAISYCHSHGVYHRDLKPENLLLDENGDLKITDFGLSALNDQIREDGLLHTLCGTPAYVAPEILAKKGYDGAKIDVWSCGVILYVLNSGYLPFNDPNLMVMYKKIYKGEFRCPKWMSPDLKRFLSRLLDTNPGTRITIDEIKCDPWFTTGYQEVKVEHLEEDFGENEKENQGSRCMNMNAFSLISFSSGLNLSGLFEVSSDPLSDYQRFMVNDSPENVIKRVETVAEEESLRLKRKKDWVVELEGQNGNYTVLKLEVCRLTDGLAVVEVKRQAGYTGLFQALLNRKIRPAILGRQE